VRIGRRHLLLNSFVVSRRAANPYPAIVVYDVVGKPPKIRPLVGIPVYLPSLRYLDLGRRYYSGNLKPSGYRVLSLVLEPKPSIRTRHARPRYIAVHRHRGEQVRIVQWLLNPVAPYHFRYQASQVSLRALKALFRRMLQYRYRSYRPRYRRRRRCVSPPSGSLIVVIPAVAAGREH